MIPETSSVCHWCSKSIDSNAVEDGEKKKYHPDCLKWAAKVWTALYSD